MRRGDRGGRESHPGGPLRASPSPGSLVSSIAVVNHQAAVLSRHHGTYMETPPAGIVGGRRRQAQLERWKALIASELRSLATVTALASGRVGPTFEIAPGIQWPAEAGVRCPPDRLRVYLTPMGRSSQTVLIGDLRPTQVLDRAGFRPREVLRAHRALVSIAASISAGRGA